MATIGFKHVNLHTPYFVDVSNVDMSVNIPSLGLKASMPVMVAPVAMQRLAHADGECGAARACAAAGTAYCIAQQATTSVEEIARSGGEGDLVQASLLTLALKAPPRFQVFYL